MAATYRYTGLNAVIIFSGTNINGDYTECTVEFKIRTEDRTAGNDTDQSFNPTIKEGTVAFKKFDVATSDTSWTLFKPGTTGTFEVRPQGTGVGLPVYSFPALVTGLKHPEQFDKNVTMEISLVKNGPMIKDLGSVQ